MEKENSKAGRYAIKGAMIGAAIAGCLALLTFNPLAVITAAVSWGIIGAGIGGLIGAFEERNNRTATHEKPAPVPVRHNPAPSHELGPDQNHQYAPTTTYQDIVTTSRTPGENQR